MFTCVFKVLPAEFQYLNFFGLKYLKSGNGAANYHVDYQACTLLVLSALDPKWNTIGDVLSEDQCKKAYADLSHGQATLNITVKLTEPAEYICATRYGEEYLNHVPIVIVSELLGQCHNLYLSYTYTCLGYHPDSMNVIRPVTEQRVRAPLFHVFCDYNTYSCML